MREIVSPNKSDETADLRNENGVSGVANLIGGGEEALAGAHF